MPYSGIIQAAQGEHAKSTYEIISELNISGLFNHLRGIKTQLQLQQSVLGKMMRANQLIKSDIKLENVNDRYLLFQAYETIQQIRYKITGEKLIYRLYITGADTAEYIEVGAENLESFIGFHKKALNIATSKIKAELKNADSNYIKGNMSVFYADAMALMRTPLNMSAQYLIQKDKNEWTYRKNRQGERMIVTYNKGHVVEAVDKIVMNQAIDDADKGYGFTSKLFYKYLKGDSVSGFKGGDTFSKDSNGFITQVQIKANSARLMRYGSIVKALNSVIEIGDEMEKLKSGGDRSQVITKIKEMYSDDSGKISSIADEIVDKFIDKFLTENLKI